MPLRAQEAVILQFHITRSGGLFHGLAFLYCNPEATAAKYGIRDLKAAPEGGVGGMTKIRKYRHTRFRAVYVDS